jgi:hypothetical protein
VYIAPTIRAQIETIKNRDFKSRHFPVNCRKYKKEREADEQNSSRTDNIVPGRVLRQQLVESA